MGMEVNLIEDPKLKSKQRDVEDFLLSKKMYFELANFYRGQKKYVDAIYFIKKEIDRNNCLAYKVTLADCYIEQKCYEQALIFINQTLEELDESSRFYYCVSILKLECLINIGEHDEAFLFIDMISNTHEVEEELLAWKAVTYLKVNEIDNAHATYASCLKINGRQGKAWLGLGSIHCIKGDYELGVACFSRALDLNPENIAAKKLKDKYHEEN